MTSSLQKGKLAYKYARIKTDLSLKILSGALRPQQRIPSLNEITRQYRVSKITARRVLNDLVTEGLVFSIRGKGSFVSDISKYPKLDKRSIRQNIGVVFENAYEPFMSDIIKGIDEETFKLSVHINLCLSNDSYEREAEILKRLVQQGIKKILLFMVISNEEDVVNPNLPLYLSLQERGIQILSIDCYLPQVPLPFISWDDYGGLKNLVEYVYKQGCRNLAYVTRVNNATTVAKRLEGFKDGLLERHLPFDSSKIIKIYKGYSETLTENTQKIMLSFLKRKTKLDAILCSDEEIASGVFQALYAMPEVKPDKILVGGFGNPKSNNLISGASYIFLEQNTYTLGRIAAEIILSGSITPTKTNGKWNVFHKILPVPVLIPQTNT